MENEWPEIGKIKQNAKLVINTLHDNGHTIIINSCRAGKEEFKMIRWLKHNGIECDYINENDPKLIAHFGSDTRKISANIYIDDKGIMGIPHWISILYRIDELEEEYANNKGNSVSHKKA